MTQPNQSNPTNEQELKQLIESLHADCPPACPHTVEPESDWLEKAITAHTNAEIARAVKEAKPFPVGGSEFADGYMAGIKQYETNLMKFIERAKLKEVKWQAED